MRNLAQKLKNALYLVRNGGHCPVCGATVINTEKTQWCAGGTNEYMKCHSCSATWTNAHVLCGVFNVQTEEEALKKEKIPDTDVYTECESLDSSAWMALQKLLDENLEDLPTLMGLSDRLDFYIAERMKQ